MQDCCTVAGARTDEETHQHERDIGANPPTIECESQDGIAGRITPPLTTCVATRIAVSAAIVPRMDAAVKQTPMRKPKMGGSAPSERTTTSTMPITVANAPSTSTAATGIAASNQAVAEIAAAWHTTRQRTARVREYDMLDKDRHDAFVCVNSELR